MRLKVRRLGDAAVIFDEATWQTHVLPPAGAVVVDLADELSDSGPVSVDRLSAALREELELDPEAPEIRELMRMLIEIGLLRR